MTSLWVSKHEKLLPSALILFCPLTSDRNLSSLRDNQLKTGLNAFRTALEATRYKMRLVIVLMSDGSESDADFEERVAGIRRATNMDSKNSFFSLPAEPLQVELREFVKSLFSTLQPSCVEYYRDLSKHARKKRNRGSVPPPTAPPTSGTSQVLSVQGWNIRYEFKLGVFAEFRQEMDAACRNYESAYEGLLGQDVFESIAGWSPRFNDTRLLADIIAIRIIRCLLWNGQTSTAVRWWTNHRSKMQELIDRKGKGTNNYGWEAWEARWSRVMAEVMIRVDLSPLMLSENPDLQMRRTGAIYAMPEKAFPIGERLPPWNMLHHAGYWYSRAAKHTMTRLQMAQQIPEEDRAAPGQSPASHIANKSYLYDTYLVPEPHVEAPLPGQRGFRHLDLVTESLRKAIKEFADRNQIRQSIRLRIELAGALMRNGEFEEAHECLWPVWKKLPWRQAGWWDLLQEFDLLLRECAVRSGDHAESVVQVDWELMSEGVYGVALGGRC
jgi:trafficking protein particle complex subunit 11